MILNSADTDFSDRFAALQSMKREQDADVHADVSAIIEAVRADGDDALYAYTKKFDRLDLKQTDMQVSDAGIDAAEAACAPETGVALENAAARIAGYHRRPKPGGHAFHGCCGFLCSRRIGKLSLFRTEERHSSTRGRCSAGCHGRARP